MDESAGPATATPLLALMAAVDERLSLMPIVGTAKRRQGLPLVVLRREDVVLDSSVENARAAAEVSGRPAPPKALVRKVFRAQIEAAKQVQLSAIKDAEYEPPESLPDIDAVLRPALLRVGRKIARLLVALPPGLDSERLRKAARTELQAPYLSDASRVAIADSIAALSQAEPAQ